MRRFMVIAIPIVTIILFISVMLSGDFLKKPLGKDDNIPQIIEELIEDINNESWDKASIKTEKLDAAWKKVISRVQFSAERDEINFFTMNIARLRGAIMSKDKSNALIELKEAYEHWVGIGK